MKKFASVLAVALLLSACDTLPRSSGFVVKKSPINDEFVYSPYSEEQYARALPVAPAQSVQPIAAIEYPASAAEPTATVPTAVAAAPVVAKAPEPECWVISPSQKKLSLALEDWGKKASPRWDVLWEHKMDFDIDATGTFCTSFEEAVETVLSTYRNSDNPPHAKFYRNHVLRVVSGAK